MGLSCGFWVILFYYVVFDGKHRWLGCVGCRTGGDVGVTDRGDMWGDGQGEMCGVTDRGDMWGDRQGEMCGVTDRGRCVG